MKEQQIARALGWFSIGLGVAELLAPRKVGKTIGVRNHNTLMRVFGLREITSGIGILSRKKPAGWMWSRVAGDALDLALLGAALSSSKNQRNRVAIAAAAVAGVAVADILCSSELSATDESPMIEGKRANQVRKSICIGRSPQDLYQFWRKFDNLPRFMEHLESVEVLSNNLSHWVAKGPAGRKVEWDAEITADRPNELIGWRSLEGSEVQNEGTVKFEPTSQGRETIVRVDMKYRPPAGMVGAKVAKLLGRAPEQEIDLELRRFKQLMETGEIPTIEGQPSGRAKSTTKYEHKVKALATA